MSGFNIHKNKSLQWALAVGIAALAASFLLQKFMLLQVSHALSFSMAILGLNLLLVFAGQVCLSQGAFFARGAYITAILVIKLGIDPLRT